MDYVGSFVFYRIEEHELFTFKNFMTENDFRVVNSDESVLGRSYMRFIDPENDELAADITSGENQGEYLLSVNEDSRANVLVETYHKKQNDR